MHVRAAATWLAIFPLVAVGMTALGVLVPTWPPVLKASVLTLLVVPTAVYFAVPRLQKVYGQIRSRNRAGTPRQPARPLRPRDPAHRDTEKTQQTK